MTERNVQQLRGMLGLCVRARQAVFGMDGCLNAVRGQTAGVLLLDAGASMATRKKYADTCSNHGVPLLELPEGLLEESTGRSGVAMAVNKGGFSERILTLAAGE